MAIPPEQLQMQEQSTMKIDATTSKTAKLDFDYLKEKARLCIKSDMGGVYCNICSNEQYFLCYSGDGFSLIDKEGHEQILNIKRDFSVSDVCWSSYLQFFFVLSNDQKLYTLDPIKQKLKMVKTLHESPIMCNCACYEKTLVLLPRKSYSSIEMYDLSSPAAIDDESIIKSLETPIQILQLALYSGEVEIEKVCFSSDGKYLALVTYLCDFNYSDSGYEVMFHLHAVRQDGNERMKREGEIVLWNYSTWLIALPDEKLLVRGRSEDQLVVLDYSKSININDDSNSNNQKLEIEQVGYNAQCKTTAFAICGNCLALVGLDGEIRLYDL